MSAHNHDPEDFNKRRFEESSNDFVAIARSDNAWLKAEDAKRLSGMNNQNAQMRDIMRDIRVAAGMGHDHMFFPHDMTGYTFKMLESLGYNVENRSGITSNFRIGW